MAGSIFLLGYVFAYAAAVYVCLNVINKLPRDAGAVVTAIRTHNWEEIFASAAVIVVMWILALVLFAAIIAPITWFVIHKLMLIGKLI